MRCLRFHIPMFYLILLLDIHSIVFHYALYVALSSIPSYNRSYIANDVKMHDVILICSIGSISHNDLRISNWHCHSWNGHFTAQCLLSFIRQSYALSQTYEWHIFIEQHWLQSEKLHTATSADLASVYHNKSHVCNVAVIYTVLYSMFLLRVSWYVRQYSINKEKLNLWMAW